LLVFHPDEAHIRLAGATMVGRALNFGQTLAVIGQVPFPEPELQGFSVDRCGLVHSRNTGKGFSL